MTNILGHHRKIKRTMASAQFFASCNYLLCVHTYKLGGKLFEPEKVNGPSYLYNSEACLYFVKAFLCQTATAAAIGGYIKVGGKLLLK